MVSEISPKPPTRPRQVNTFIDFWLGQQLRGLRQEMGLSLKDSAPGFDPHAALAAYGDDDDDAFVEDEQY